jgi:hypothetical protein
MGVRVAALNFTKGEISPEVEARFDLDVTKAALRKASNVIIKRTGGVRKRPGSRFATAAMSPSARLFPFQFSDTQAYALEFDQAKMRPFALGGAVLEPGLKVTAITIAEEAQVTAPFHGYSPGDPVWFDGIQGMVEINDRFLTVMEVMDQNNFTVNFDSRFATPFVADSGGQVNTSPPSAPPSVPSPPTPTPAPTPPKSSGGGSGGYGNGGQWTGSGVVHPQLS